MKDTNKYFEVEELEQKEEGFKSSNTIKIYKEDNKLEYPLLLLSNASMATYKIKTLKNMLDEESLLTKDLYNVYVFFEGTLMKIGKLSGEKLRVVLNTPVFKEFKKQVMLDENVIIEGDLLQALCIHKEFD